MEIHEKHEERGIRMQPACAFQLCDKQLLATATKRKWSSIQTLV